MRQHLDSIRNKSASINEQIGDALKIIGQLKIPLQLY